VPLNPFLEDFQNLLSGHRGFESSTFEFVHVFGLANESEGHCVTLPCQ
jgi:hypothetical protein